MRERSGCGCGGNNISQNNSNYNVDYSIGLCTSSSSRVGPVCCAYTNLLHITHTLLEGRKEEREESADDDDGGGDGRDRRT